MTLKSDILSFEGSPHYCDVDDRFVAEVTTGDKMVDNTLDQ